MPIRSSRQRTLFALAGAGALMGWLLASGAAAPVIADVVARVSPEPAAATAQSSIGTTVNGKRVALSDSTTGTTGSSGTWMDGDQRPEWSTQRQVPQGPSGTSAVQPPSNPQAPLIQVPENPKARELFVQGAPMRRYDLKPRGACPQSHGKGLHVGQLAAEPGAGSATISWWDLGDPNTIEYRITAVPITGPGQVTTKTVAAPKTCKNVSMAFTGLTSGTSYLFMITAANSSPEQGGRIYRADRGQTPTITIT